MRELRLAISAVTTTGYKQGFRRAIYHTGLEPDEDAPCTAKHDLEISFSAPKQTVYCTSISSTDVTFEYSCLLRRFTFTTASVQFHHQTQLSLLLLVRAMRISSPPCIQDQSDHILRVHGSGSMESVATPPIIKLCNVTNVCLFLWIKVVNIVLNMGILSTDHAKGNHGVVCLLHIASRTHWLMCGR